MADKTSDGKNFFQKLLDSLFNSNDPAALKKKQLRAIAKDLAKSHSNFYKFTSDEIQPAFAKLFYQIYKAIDNSQILFQTMNNPAAIKNQIVTSSLSEGQITLSNELTEPVIREKAKTIPISELSEQVKKQIDVFVTSFDMEKITKIDSLYTTFLNYQAFCKYDFYFLLKKFCASLKEHTFTDTPHFDPILIEYVKDDLKDFVSVAWPLEKDASWTALLDFFKTLRGKEPIAAKTWTQVVSRLDNLKRERTLEKLIKLAVKDPNFEPEFSTQSGNIVEPYIDKVRSEALQAINKLQSEIKKTQVDNILMQLFGTEYVVRLKYYNEQANTEFIKHNLPNYSFYLPLNYLKAFLIDFVKSELRVFADLVLIRGQWSSTALSSPMSDAYNELLDFSTKITEFDEKLAEDGAVGIKIKTLMPRTLRERDAAKIASSLIEDANDEAKGYLVACTKDLIIIGKTIKSLLEDYAKMPRAELLINWKQLEHFADDPIKDSGVSIYKKIYLFSQLMQTMIGKN